LLAQLAQQVFRFRGAQRAERDLYRRDVRVTERRVAGVDERGGGADDRDPVVA
jgi:hypothetical protein